MMTLTPDFSVHKQADRELPLPELEEGQSYNEEFVALLTKMCNENIEARPRLEEILYDPYLKIPYREYQRAMKD